MLTVMTPSTPMRSAGVLLIFMSHVRTEFTRRAFSLAVPTAYNSLPFGRQRQVPSKDIFSNSLV